MPNKLKLLLMSFLLSLTMGISPIYASPVAPAHPNTPQTVKPSSDQKGPCIPCQRPFKRLIKSMYMLKKANEMTTDEFKKAYTTVVKMPKETFKDVADPDLKAAELLHKRKMITDDQYKKICASLKNMPLPQKTSSAPNSSSAS